MTVTACWGKILQSEQARESCGAAAGPELLAPGVMCELMQRTRGVPSGWKVCHDHTKKGVTAANFQNS